MNIILNNFMTGLGKALLGSNAMDKGREAFDNLKLARANQELPSLRPATKFGEHNTPANSGAIEAGSLHRSYLAKQVGATLPS